MKTILALIALGSATWIAPAQQKQFCQSPGGQTGFNRFQNPGGFGQQRGGFQRFQLPKGMPCGIGQPQGIRNFGQQGGFGQQGSFNRFGGHSGQMGHGQTGFQRPMQMGWPQRQQRGNSFGFQSHRGMTPQFNFPRR